MSAAAVDTGRYAPDRSGRYVAPAGGSPAIAGETPYSAALRCLAPYTARRPLRIAVGNIADDTGSEIVTRGAALMAISALAKAGVPLVERFDTSIAEAERRFAGNGMGGAPMPPGADRGAPADVVPGSDYYLIGGITELNFNLYSEDTGIAPGSGVTVMSIGLDLRLVNSRSLEVADVVSYRKQIVGYRQSGFAAFPGHSFPAGGGTSAQEPIQLAVRSTIERAVLEMVTRLYRAPAQGCAAAIGGAADPLAGPGDRLSGAPPLRAVPQTPVPERETARPVSRGAAHRDAPAGSARLRRARQSAAEPRLRRSLD